MPLGCSNASEWRPIAWQNAPINPTSQAWFMYDGEGHRVEQYVSGGSGNHTYYLPGNEVIVAFSRGKRFISESVESQYNGRFTNRCVHVLYRRDHGPFGMA